MTKFHNAIADAIVGYYKRNNGVRTRKEAIQIEFEKSYSRKDVGYMITILEEKGILTCEDGVVKTLFSLSSKGWKYESFSKLLEDEHNEAELKRRKGNVDLVNAERIKSTYWLTFGLALAAFLISLALAIPKLIELVNSKNKKYEYF